MGLLNNALGINLTNHNPVSDGPFSEGQSTGFVNPPPPGFFMITETGAFMQTETGNNLMVLE
jgi:hypothetical protein